MDFLTWGRNPWGQRILTHISWDLAWAALFAGLMFLVAHASYMILSANKKSHSGEVDALEAANKDLPAKITRHTFMARMFHWVMAAAMFTLLFTSFLPIVGVKFAWVQWHWMAGLLLTGSIIYHIIHATFFMDFWSIWIGPKDIPEFKAQLDAERGLAVNPPKDAKYPLGNRLYHLALVVVGLSVSISGMIMMSRNPPATLHAQPVHHG
ncbi:MAG: cytochrome b/b6 domain-containing protein [Vicinamibacterales bacterium]